MIKTITGNWYRQWSPQSEAGTRVCRVEGYLHNNGFTLTKDRPVCASTSRVIFDDEMLTHHIQGKRVEDSLTERIMKDWDVRKFGRLIWDMRNIQPQEYRGYYRNKRYKPGEIQFRYAKDETEEGFGGYIEIVARTLFPHKGAHIRSSNDQTIFDLGSTDKLIVDIRTRDDELCEKLNRVARKKD